jgi:hypothetical protein
MVEPVGLDSPGHCEVTRSCDPSPGAADMISPPGVLFDHARIVLCMRADSRAGEEAEGAVPGEDKSGQRTEP